MEKTCLTRVVQSPRHLHPMKIHKEKTKKTKRTKRQDGFQFQSSSSSSSARQMSGKMYQRNRKEGTSSTTSMEGTLEERLFGAQTTTSFVVSSSWRGGEPLWQATVRKGSRRPSTPT